MAPGSGTPSDDLRATVLATALRDGVIIGGAQVEEEMEPSEVEGFRPDRRDGDTRVLAVLLHGLGRGPAAMADVDLAVVDAFGEGVRVDRYVPELPHRMVLSTTPPETIVARLVAALDTICAEPGRYREIVLVGFSVGAALARHLFLEGMAPRSERPPRPWAERITRIVSLGGIHRGWRNSGRMGWWLGTATTLVELVGHALPGRWSLTIFHLRRGAPFIVEGRLRWLRFRREQENDPKRRPILVQLLGTRDAVVAPDDAVDFAVDREDADPFFCIELPGTTHARSVDFREGLGPDGALLSASSSAPGPERRERFVLALTAGTDELKGRAVPSKRLVDSLPPAPDRAVRHVVFVVHGIRDDGFWTRRIAARIQEQHERAEAEGELRCVTASYGYFAMLPFLLPWIRRGKVEWWMDEVVAVEARFPNAALSYVGHSNGSYIAARALREYPSLRLHHVVFAGSVVRSDFDWQALFEAGRVHRVRNLVATADWVVALFPRGLQVNRWFDLGGAGWDGFGDSPSLREPLNLRYVSGGHGAGVSEGYWDAIAQFIVRGDRSLDDRVPSVSQSRFWAVVAKLSPALLFLLALAVCATPFILYYRLGLSPARGVLAVVAYVLMMRIIMVKV